MSNINEVRGWFNYEGITTMQHSDVLKPLEILINDIQPKRLLEIGTASGGLTLILRDILDKLQFNECTLRTYDINPDFDRCILQDNIANGKNIDFRLVGGSAVFGIGWGIAGFCPGGALPVLGTGNTDVFLFVLSLLAGVWAVRLYTRFTS